MWRQSCRHFQNGCKRVPFLKWLHGFLACVAIFEMVQNKSCHFENGECWISRWRGHFIFGGGVSFGDVAILILATRLLPNREWRILGTPLVTWCSLVATAKMATL